MSCLNFQEWLRQHNNNKKPRYRIQRLSIGVVSLLTATWILSSATTSIAAESGRNGVEEETNQWLRNQEDQLPSPNNDGTTVGEELIESTKPVETTDEGELKGEENIESTEGTKESTESGELIGVSNQSADEPAHHLTEQPENSEVETSMDERVNKVIFYNAVAEEPAESNPVVEGDMRIHIDGRINPTDKGLWVWGGTRHPSENWPSGATPIDSNNKDSFGHYVDIPMKEGTEPLGAIIVNRYTGDKINDDMFVNRTDEKQQHIWLEVEDATDPNNVKFKQHLYEPIKDENILRVNYYREDGNYDNYGLWVWGNGVLQNSENYPTGALSFNQRGLWGAYLDLPIKADSKDINFQIVNKNTKEHSSDMKFTGRHENSQVFLREMVGEVYTNPYFKETEKPANPEPVAEGDMRIHIDGRIDPSDKGLWVWGGTSHPSDGWPSGAISIDPSNKDDFGYYVDIPMKQGTETLGALIVNRNTGEKDTEDMFIDRVDEAQQHVWLELAEASNPNDVKYKQHLYEPIQNENILRVNYYREDGDYDNYGLWVWGDGIQEESKDFPMGALSFEQRGLWGAYLDLPIKAGATDINFLIVNKKTREQTGDMKFTDRHQDSQIFLREMVEEVYTNPYFKSDKFPGTAELYNDETIVITINDISPYTDEQLSNEFNVKNNDGQDIEITTTKINRLKQQVELKGNFKYENIPYTVYFDHLEVGQVLTSWRIMDDLYAYDGPLGAEIHQDGTVTVTVWAPTADAIQAVIYDKEDQTKEVVRVDLTKAHRGSWTVDLNQDNTQLTDLTGYFYHYEITRGDEKVLVLDPYAKSMAAWNSDDTDKIGKGAFVDPDQIGPELDYAHIPGFEKREDAIIYEVHVRDFTSDKALEGKLENQFGTFTAFIENLDYLKDLGVTHIQLLPVMSYIKGNELNNKQREWEYASSDQNYNWGYDPQSYFALSGMYSDDPTNPTRRIEEFKELVDAIHERGMGVILDVVYNHTGAKHVLEDLQPGYYNFTDDNGHLIDAFGGGALDTRRHMSRRLLVDSIVYWTKHYKVDGFRFDMMGEHDLETIQMAYDEAAKLNPNTLFLGEGWITYKGPDNVVAADQRAMNRTRDISVFSDEIRNELKSGFGSEGQPRFLTGGKRNVHLIFNNVIANPTNVLANDPGNIIQYIAAHDNLSLHDVIAQSIKKDPKYHQQEIHQRIRLGNMIILTSQGIPFVHSGQEYGRTKQFRHPDYKEPVDTAPANSTFMTDNEGKPFEYLYFIDNSYDASDSVNHFDWDKVTDKEANPITTNTYAYTRGLIHLRRSTDAFRYGTTKEIADNVRLLISPSIEIEDLVLAYKSRASNGDDYLVIINADDKERKIVLEDDDRHFLSGHVLADGAVAGTETIDNLTGVTLNQDSVTLAPLTGTIIKLDSPETELANKLAEAQAAVEEAERRQTEARGALDKANADGLITPNEVTEIERVNVQLQEAIDQAQKAVNQVPEGEERTGLQTRLDALSLVEVPEVTDVNADGVLDVKQLADAVIAVKEAENCQTEVRGVLEEANVDGLITPDEVTTIEEANAQLQDVINTAQEAVNQVPEGEERDEIESRLDKLAPVEVPTVTDVNADGVLDTEQLADAESAVKEAERRQTEAQGALDKANADGLITPDEVTTIEEANAQLEEVINNAKEAVNQVPEGEEQTGLQRRLDALNLVEVPTVTDENADGVLDDKQVADAEKAVVEAERRQIEALGILEKANADGLITPDEVTEIEEGNVQLQEVINTAQEAVNQVPEGEERDELEGRLDKLAPVEVPTVTDANADGVLDTEQLADAEIAVSEAERRQTEVQGALDKANADGLVTPAEVTTIEDANVQLQLTIDKAQEAVNQVPEGEERSGLQTRLDVLSPFEVPEVTDVNADGKLDFVQLADAEKAVMEAERLQGVAQASLEEVNIDGLINPEEVTVIQKANEDLEEAIEKAQIAINNTPASANRIVLQERLDNLGSVEVPAVTDKNADGILDAGQIESEIPKEPESESPQEHNESKSDSHSEADRPEVLNDSGIKPQQQEEETPETESKPEIKSEVESDKPEVPNDSDTESQQEALSPKIPNYSEIETGGKQDILEKSAESGQSNQVLINQKSNVLPETGEDRVGIHLASLASLLAGIGLLGYSVSDKSWKKGGKYNGA